MQQPVLFWNRSASLWMTSTWLSMCLTAPRDGGPERIFELGQPVVNPHAFSTRFDQAGLAKVCQVPRHFRLGNPEALVNVADADLSVEEQAENAQPCRVSQRLEKDFQLIQLFRHIYVLTNISRGSYRLYIRLCVCIRETMNDIQEAVRQRYGAIAEAVKNSTSAPSCCGPTQCGCGDPISADLYSADETASLPDTAVSASLGMRNSTALSDLQPGETVLDLGSGGGIDVLLSAKRVGPTGFAYGLDMTDEMLDLAEQNRLKAGASRTSISSKAISRRCRCPTTPST